MKRLVRILLCLAISLGALNAHAQRAFNQAELDALLAPIALYPDPVITQVLNASVFPQDVAAAAAWSRANPQLQGDDALRAVDRELWHPSVKALVAYPDVLARMAESPQWLADLGEAYTGAAPYVNATIQQLRARAEANGNLQSNNQQYVYRQGEEIMVQPVYPQVVYVPYYNPYLVYGTWWWGAYRPVYWRPWVARPIIVTRIVQPVRIVHQPVRVTPYRPVPESRRMPIIQNAPAFGQPIAQPMRAAPPAQPLAPWHRGPVAQSAPAVAQWHRAPIAQSAPIMRHAPALQAAPAPRMAQGSFGRAFHPTSGGGNRGGGQHRS